MSAVVYDAAGRSANALQTVNRAFGERDPEPERYRPYHETLEGR